MARFRALLLGFFVLAYILPLNHRPLIKPDETRYAEIPRAMADGGSWLELRLVGLPYYEKPPLGYWLGAACLSALGRHNLAVRLPMALAAGGTALTIFLLVKAYRRRTDLALGAAAVYLAFPQVFGLGTFAVLDSIFTFFVTLSLALFFHAVNATGRRPAGRWRRPAWLVLSGLACAGAFLTKGFTALVLPVLVLAAWLTWRGLIKKHLLDCLVPVLAATLAVLPAVLALHRANPDFWNYFFWVEHVQRFLRPIPEQHEQPFWFYLPCLLGGALPWTFCLFRALDPIRAKAKAGDALTTFCLAWLVLPFLFFSACGGKLLTYILPCFPPLAIMLAETLMESPRDFSSGLKICAALYLVLALALGVLVWLLLVGPFPPEPSLLPADTRLWSLVTSLAPKNLQVGEITFPWGLVAGLGLTGLGLKVAANNFKSPELTGRVRLETAGRRTDNITTRLSGLFRVALASLPIFLAASFGLPEAFTNHRAPSGILAEAAPLTPPGAALFTDRNMLTAAAWHYRRNDLVIAFGPGELAYGLKQPEGRARHVSDVAGLAELILWELDAGRPAAFMAAGDDDHEADLTRALDGLESDLTLKRGSFIWMLYRPGSGL